MQHNHDARTLVDPTTDDRIAREAFEDDPDDDWGIEEEYYEPPPNATEGQEAKAARLAADRKIQQELDENGGDQKKEHTGTWIPIQVEELVEKGVLTTTEAWLFVTISSFKRCFMSNEKLAKRCGVKSESTVRNMLHKLKKLKLVKQISFNGRMRVLVSKWNR